MDLLDDCKPTQEPALGAEQSASTSTELGEDEMEAFLCPVDEAARIIGQKWTLQIVHDLLDNPGRRFCELQEALGGVNPSTLSSRLKMLEEAGVVHRAQVSAIPPHVEYSLTDMGHELRDVIAAVTHWSNSWLCNGENHDCAERARGDDRAATVGDNAPALSLAR